MKWKKESILEKALALQTRKLQNYTTEESTLLANAQSILDERAKILYDLDDEIGELRELRTVYTHQEENWQPSDLLPNVHMNGWHQLYKEIIELTTNLPLGIQATLVGNMITEEGLPTYAVNIHTPVGKTDVTGTLQTNYAIWDRTWQSDENKHGEAMKQGLGFSRKIIMRSVEDSIQNVLRDGFNPGTGRDPIKLAMYTGFQEPATEISHINTAKIAKKQGNKLLHDICRKITGDESRHKSFYQALVQKIFAADPDSAMTAYAYLMKKGIDMPAQLLTDTYGNPLFKKFSAIARQEGVYTAEDYVKILKQTNRKYDIAQVQVYSDDAKKAQEFLVGLPERLLTLSQRADRTREYVDPSSLPWFRT